MTIWIYSGEEPKTEPIPEPTPKPTSAKSRQISARLDSLSKPKRKSEAGALNRLGFHLNLRLEHCRREPSVCLH